MSSTRSAMAVILKKLNEGMSVEDQIPLTVAASNNDQEIMELLIMRGAGVNTPDQNGRVPLARSTDPECIKLLLRHKADVNHEGPNSITPLMFATDPECIKLLLQHKADINHETRNGYNPLMCAIKNYADKAVECLLEHKANLETKRNHSHHVAYAASDQINRIQARDPEEEEKMQTKLDGKMDSIYKYLNKARVRSSMEKILKKLTEGKDIVSEAPLTDTSSTNDQEIMELLIMCGAGVNTPDQKGRVPLCHSTDPECIKLLLRHNANIDQEDPRGNTSLFYALASLEDGTVKCLLEHKATLKAKRDPFEVLQTSVAVHRGRFASDELQRRVDSIFEKLNEAKAAEEAASSSLRL